MWSPTSVERTVAFFENIMTVPKDEVHDCVARWKWQLGSVGRVARWKWQLGSVGRVA